MGIEEQLEELVRRAVHDGIAQSRTILREEIRAALAEANGTGDQPDSEDEVDTKAAAHVKPRATTRGS